MRLVGQYNETQFRLLWSWSGLIFHDCPYRGACIASTFRIHEAMVLEEACTQSLITIYFTMSEFPSASSNTHDYREALETS